MQLPTLNCQSNWKGPADEILHANRIKCIQNRHAIYLKLNPSFKYVEHFCQQDRDENWHTAISNSSLMIYDTKTASQWT